MYDGYKVYGPYGSHRKIAVLVSPDHRTTMSWARYVMSVHLGRELTRDEEVDHVDDDCTNDELSNLQVLTPAKNLEKSYRQRAAPLVTLVCPGCKREFTRLKREVKVANPCCSRSCSARYHTTGRTRRTK